MSGRERTLALSSAYPSTPDESGLNVGQPALSGRCTVTSLTTAPSHEQKSGAVRLRSFDQETAARFAESLMAAPLLIAAVTKDGSKLALELPPLVPHDAKALRACLTDLKRPRQRVNEQVEDSAPRAVHECLEKKGDDAAVHLFVEGGAALHLFVESGAIESLRTEQALAGQALADGFGNGGDKA